MKFRFSTFVSIVSLAAMTVLGVGCQDDKLPEDENNFTLTYGTLAITNTAESNGNILAAPDWTGKTPSAFEITGVTIGGKSHTGNFEIVRDNGSIKVTGAEDLALGDYKISVACMSGGKRFDLADAAVITVMASVSDAVEVTPVELSFDVSEIGVAEAVEKTTAKITVKDNRQITSIEVANVVRNGESGKNNSLFTVDDEGVISPVDVEGFPDGKFVISLKIVIDEEEGLVANCLTVNVSARPVALEYSEALAGWQLAAGEDPKTFTSVEPVLSGSSDGVEYAINQINAPDEIDPEEGMLTIDSGTGVVTLTTTDKTKPGNYSVTFKVKNVWVEDFVEVEGVLDVQVTEPAHSIDNFSYDPANRVVSNETSDKTFPVSEMDGERVAFSLVSDEVPASLADKLEVDPDDGTITLKGGASGLKPGLYAVPVYAVNNTTPEGKTALFYLTVCEQDKFTFFSYGNNFETVKEQIAAGTTSQFRYDGNVTATTLPVLFSDFPENSEITWRAEAKNSQVKELSIDNSGNLSFTTACVSAEQVAVIFVTAKVGNTSITQPVFVNVPIPTIGGDYVVKYTPFVIRCKPNVEGTVYSSVPDITPKPDVVDHRAEFNYWNINGKYSDDTLLKSGKLANNNHDLEENPLKYLWVTTSKAPTNSASNNGGVGVNFGSKDPISIFKNTGSQTLNGETRRDEVALYVDTDFRVAVNPDKWIITPFEITLKEQTYKNDKSGIFDGVFCGRCYYGEAGGDYRATTYALWIDQNYVPINQE